MNHFSRFALAAGFLLVGNAVGMEGKEVLQPTQAITALISAYLDACCYRPNPENLKPLLDDKCTLVHVTNGKIVSQAQGIEEVMKAYQDNLFSKTTKIEVKRVEISSNDISGGELISGETFDGQLKLIVEEDKPDARYSFQDMTLFGFNKSHDRITSISTLATKQKLWVYEHLGW